MLFRSAIDMPSGLTVDRLPYPDESIVLADFTLTFQTPKLTFFLPSAGGYAGQWKVLDIGLDKDYLSNAPSDYFALNDQSVFEKNLLTVQKNYNRRLSKLYLHISCALRRFRAR